jgi:5-methylcytosine-specific restriction enzyme A
MALREVLERISNEYASARAQPLKDHPTADYIRDLATAEVQSVLAAANPDLIAFGSPGKGNWAAAPWIAIFDPVVTQTATRGYYVVYLFHVSEPVLHLSLNQGTTATREEFKEKPRQVLADRAGFMRKRLADFADLLPVKTIELGSNARLPGDYAAAHALGISYRLDQLPSEEELRTDLATAIRAYRALTFRGGLDLVADEETDAEHEPAALSLVEKRQYRLHRRIERNAAAARLAKKHHGTRCQVCELDFGESYGVIGKGFIEAHHLKPISTLSEGTVGHVQHRGGFCRSLPQLSSHDPSDVRPLRPREVATVVEGGKR